MNYYKSATIIFFLCVVNILLIQAKGLYKTSLNSDGLYGYVDEKGDVVVPNQYMDPPNSFLNNEFYEDFGLGGYPTGDFLDGMAKVYKKNKGFGYINENGIEIIPCQYENALCFTEGLAAIKNKDNLWGYIDKKGRVVIPFKYSTPGVFRNGLAQVAIRHKEEYKAGYINKKGKIVVPFKYDYDAYGHFSNGLAVVTIKEKKENEYQYKYGYIDTLGNIVIPLKYSDATPFSSNGYAGVKMEKWGKMGMINKNNQVIIPFKYDYLFKDIDGYVVAVRESKWGMISLETCSEVIPCIYDDILPFKEDICAAKRNGKYGFLNKAGKIIIPFDYDDVGDFSYGMANAEKSGKMGFINIFNEIVIPFEYDRAFPFFVEGLAYVIKDGNWSIINSMGELLLPFGFPQDYVKAKYREFAKTNFRSPVDCSIPKAKTQNNNTFVIIIANEEYTDENIPTVQFAKRDGEVFRQYCELSMGIPSTNIHFRENATFNQIRSEINWGKKMSDALDGNAKIIIYYAGHGIPNEVTKSANILPSDATASDIQSSYPLSQLYKQLSEYNAKQVLVLMDACFSGMQRGGKAIISSRGVAIKPAVDHISGKVVVISATQGDESAYSYMEHKHGMFTYFILKKLQESDANTTIGELYKYVQSEVLRTSLIANGRSQTPTISISPSLGTEWQNWKLK